MVQLRSKLLVGGLIGIAALGVAIAIYFNQFSKLTPVEIAAYFPKREAALLYLDVDLVRRAGLLEQIVGSAVGEEPEYKEFLSGTGFDYKRDLDRVMMSSGQGQHYFVLQGRFDWEKLEGYAGKQGGKCESGFCSLPGSESGRLISFYPINKTLMALASGPEESAAKRIERRAAEKLTFDPPTAPVWIHVPGAVLQSQKEAPSGTKLFLKALEAAQDVLVTLDAKSGGSSFEVAMNVNCRSEADAATLKAQMEGITTLLQKLIAREKQTPSTSDLSGVLTAGKFERQANRVLAKWPVERALLQSLTPRN